MHHDSNDQHERGSSMHESGKTRMEQMKAHVDRPIGTLIKELKERGLLERTLVVVATEFGRTIANQPAAGSEPDGFAEKSDGGSLVIGGSISILVGGTFLTAAILSAGTLLRRRTAR